MPINHPEPVPAGGSGGSWPVRRAVVLVLVA